MTICCKDYLSWYKLHLSAMNYCILWELTSTEVKHLCVCCRSQFMIFCDTVRILWELTSTEVKHLCVCCRSQFMIFCDTVHIFWSIFYIHLWIRFWVNYSPHPRAIMVPIPGWIQFYHSVSWAESYRLLKELCSSSDTVYRAHNLIPEPYIGIPKKNPVWLFSWAIQLQLLLDVIGCFIISAT
jgi:hypothetical protein